MKLRRRLGRLSGSAGVLARRARRPAHQPRAVRRHAHRAAAHLAPRYLSGLNPEQRRAVEALDGPVLVLAGAGVGKTRVLTTRIAHLIASGRARPHEILAVTFTNKAAREMRERVGLLTGVPDGLPWLGTFHAVGAKLLRRHAELVGLRREQVDLRQGLMHVRRRKNGSPSTHPLRGPEIRALRRLLYCGEYIESHALHMVMLHAPDFLGYPSAIELARDHRAVAAMHAGRAGLDELGEQEILGNGHVLGAFQRRPAARSGALGLGAAHPGFRSYRGFPCGALR